MILSENILDQFYMLKDCRTERWNFDLRTPVFPGDENPEQEITAASQIKLGWELEDIGSGVSIININVYGYETDEEVSLEVPDDGQDNITLTGEKIPEEEEIGWFGDDNSWRLTYNPPKNTDENYIISGTGDNEKGNIFYHFTAFDQACNHTLAVEEVNLNPWITSKGGLVHSDGSVGNNAKDVSTSLFLNDVLRRVRADELDTGTELISSRSGTAYLAHSNLGAVRAQEAYNSNSKKTFWFNYLKSKLENQKEVSELTLTAFESLEDATSSTCSGENCYLYTNVDVTIPRDFVCDKNTLIISEKSIYIEPDIEYGSDDNISGCIFLARDNITIGAGAWKTGWIDNVEEMKYDYIDAFMIAENKIDIPLVDVSEEVTGDEIEHRDGLEIHGGLVALGRDLTQGESAVDIKRSLKLYNNYMPTVVTSWDPRYAKLSEIFFGTSAVMYKQEVGFKPY